MVTIEQFINSKSPQSFDYEFLSLYEKLSTVDGEISIISYSMINDYYTDIRDLSIEVTLNDEDFIKYKLNPEKLCRELYGSTHLYFIILALNEMSSPKDFNKKKIRMLRVADMRNLVNFLYNAELEAKNLNEQKIK